MRGGHLFDASTCGKDIHMRNTGNLGNWEKIRIQIRDMHFLGVGGNMRYSYTYKKMLRVVSLCVC